ncbi:unnamed protein product [Mytilus coruscus]|uniref:C1q domain-containing protein n=1 Tax=Mytilus coruscus TaxID=42192 RepID=A0A6J8BI08_MYTCO|nr:unnamed protein product [Mytilus coruscus]
MKSVEVPLLMVYIYTGYISCADVDLNKLLNRVLINEKWMQDRMGGLEKQVVELQSEIRHLKEGKLYNDGSLSEQNRSQRLLIDQTEQQTKVAFSAYMSNSLDASQISSRTQIRYDNTECNVDKAYDANTGAFIAPVRGTYVFICIYVDYMCWWGLRRARGRTCSQRYCPWKLVC